MNIRRELWPVVVLAALLISNIAILGSSIVSSSEPAHVSKHITNGAERRSLIQINLYKDNTSYDKRQCNLTISNGEYICDWNDISTLQINTALFEGFNSTWRFGYSANSGRYNLTFTIGNMSRLTDDLEFFLPDFGAMEPLEPWVLGKVTGSEISIEAGEGSNKSTIIKSSSPGLCILAQSLNNDSYREGGYVLTDFYLKEAGSTAEVSSGLGLCKTGSCSIMISRIWITGTPVQEPDVPDPYRQYDMNYNLSLVQKFEFPNNGRQLLSILDVSHNGASISCELNVTPNETENSSVNHYLPNLYSLNDTECRIRCRPEDQSAVFSRNNNSQKRSPLQPVTNYPLLLNESFTGIKLYPWVRSELETFKVKVSGHQAGKRLWMESQNFDPDSETLHAELRSRVDTFGWLCLALDEGRELRDIYLSPEVDHRVYAWKEVGFNLYSIYLECHTNVAVELTFGNDSVEEGTIDIVDMDVNVEDTVNITTEINSSYQVSKTLNITYDTNISGEIKGPSMLTLGPMEGRKIKTTLHPDEGQDGRFYFNISLYNSSFEISRSLEFRLNTSNPASSNDTTPQNDEVNQTGEEVPGNESHKTDLQRVLSITGPSHIQVRKGQESWMDIKAENLINHSIELEIDYNSSLLVHIRNTDLLPRELELGPFQTQSLNITINVSSQARTGEYEFNISMRDGKTLLNTGLDFTIVVLEELSENESDGGDDDEADSAVDGEGGEDGMEGNSERTDGTEREDDGSPLDGGGDGASNEDGDEDIPIPILPTVGITVILVSLFGMMSTEYGRFHVWRMAIPILPLYSRINQDNVLENVKRRMIIEYIMNNPGVNLTQLRTDLNLPNGTAVHHITMLKKNGLIISRRDGRKVRFYPPLNSDNKISPLEHATPSLNEDSETISISWLQWSMIRAILENQGTTLKKLAAQLGKSKQVVNYHLRVLIDSGYIIKKRKKRIARYYVTEKSDSELKNS